jgi:hypothetical protein
MTAIVESRALDSVKSLIIANVIAIVIALYEGWYLREVMLIYWTQSVIIGYFSFRRMLDLKEFSTKGVRMNGRPVEPTEKTKRSMAWFFVAHYGFFHIAYLFYILGDGSEEFHGSFFFVAVCAVVFAFNHWYSYVEHRDEDAERKPNIGTIMLFPYGRILPMHLTIVAGGSLSGTSTTALLLFLGLKTLADVIMHKVEHSGWKALAGQ